MPTTPQEKKETPCCPTRCHRPRKPITKGAWATIAGLLVLFLGLAIAGFMWTESNTHAERLAKIAAHEPAVDEATLQHAPAIIWAFLGGASLLIASWLTGAITYHRMVGKRPKCSRMGA